MMAANNAVNMLFISAVRPPSKRWDPGPFAKKHSLEKEEKQLIQQIIWLVKTWKGMITLNFYEKILNNFFRFLVVFISWTTI